LTGPPYDKGHFQNTKINRGKRRKEEKKRVQESKEIKKEGKQKKEKRQVWWLHAVFCYLLFLLT
jgi:hypothetical protein